MNRPLTTNTATNDGSGSNPRVSGAQPHVPPPLPGAFDPDFQLMSLLSEADRALGELAGLGRTLANPGLLMGPFMRREAVLSSRIEGTQSDLTDIYAYEAGGQLPIPEFGTPAPVQDVREVLNYVTALQYGLERLGTLPVSLRLIREVHERLMKGVRGDSSQPGEFRAQQNWIGPAGSPIEDATYIPPDVPGMKACLNELESYLHQENGHPPLIRLAMIHYQFEAIHPFLDGNGRVGRLLIILLLIEWGLLPHPLLYLSAFFEQHRQEYYDRLLGVSRNGEWREWIAYFLRGVAEGSRDSVEKARKLLDLQSEMRATALAQSQSALVIGVIDFLFERPILTAKVVADRFNKSRQGGIDALRKLGETGMGFVSERRAGREIYFVADQIVEILT